MLTFLVICICADSPLLTTTNKDDDVSSDDMILQQYLSMDEFEPEVFLCQVGTLFKFYLSQGDECHLLLGHIMIIHLGRVAAMQQ